MRTGYTYPKTALFVDSLEAAITITSDDFEMEILDSDGNVVDTLSIGSGLAIVAPNKLNISVGPPVTGSAGTYTGTLVWTRLSTSGILPIIDFTFIIG